MCGIPERKSEKFPPIMLSGRATLSVRLEFAEILVLCIIINKSFDFNYDNGFDINEFISAILIKITIF